MIQKKTPGSKDRSAARKIIFEETKRKIAGIVSRINGTAGRISGIVARTEGTAKRIFASTREIGASMEGRSPIEEEAAVGGAKLTNLC
jgi:hypothetical protein